MRMLPLTYSAAKACSLSRPLASFMNSFADLYHTHISASGRESHSFGSAAKISVVNRWPLHLMSQQLFSAAMSRRALHVPAPSTCMPLSRAQTSCGRRNIAGERVRSNDAPCWRGGRGQVSGSRREIDTWIPLVYNITPKI